MRKGNVGDIERLISTAVGGILLERAIRKRSLGSILLAAAGASMLKRGVTGRCDIYSALGLSTAQPLSRSGIRLEETVTVSRPAAEVYAYWRNFTNLVGVLPHVESVDMTDAELSHWKAHGPGGMEYEWDAQIITEKENELISWKTVGNPEVIHTGSVRFREVASRGTEVTVLLRYQPPFKTVGWAFAALLGASPEKEFREGLRRLKQKLEAGDVIQSTRSESQEPIQLH
ncbi:MAG: SRPBCC family protein [Bdellovibrionota bacterium]